MDPLRHLVETRGFFTRAEALAAGWTDRRLGAERRAGTWHRVSQGYYTCDALWRGLGRVGRHQLRADAACHEMAGVVALSHVSGALVHELAVWDVPLDPVHVTRLDDGAGRCANGVRHHQGVVTPDELQSVGGRPVLSPVRCALETALMTDQEHGLVVLDSLLRLGLATSKELEDRYDAMESWPGAQKLRRIVALADAGGASPGETRTRWLLRAAGLPPPELQYEVRGHDGELFATCDMAWPELGVILEFDGREKYERLRAVGTTAGDVVYAEKRREDRIRELTGFVVVRVVWADLQRPAELARRVRGAMAAAAASRSASA